MLRSGSKLKKLSFARMFSALKALEIWILGDFIVGR